MGVAFCNIDQPSHRDGLEPTAVATAPPGLCPLPRPNRDNWFSESAGRDGRYDYLYTATELEPWIERIRRLREHAERIFVITNNHYRGQAAANALQLAHRIRGRKVEAPEPLVRVFPALKGITTGQDPCSELPAPLPFPYRCLPRRLLTGSGIRPRATRGASTPGSRLSHKE